MAIQLIAPATNKNAETLALIQALGQTAGQGVAGYVAGQDRQKKQQGEQAVLASLMQGQPGQMGAGGMGPPTAGTPGLSEQEAMAALMSGAAPDIIASRYKQPSAGEGFTLNPGDVRYDASGRVVAQVPGETKPPQTRDVLQGGERVFQQFDQATGQWVEIGRGPAFAPQSSVNVYNAPSGYRATPDGNLEAIPGGPATRLSGGPEASGRMLIPTSIGSIPDIKAKLFPGGQFDPALAVKMQIPGSAEEALANDIQAGTMAVLRIESGGAITDEELYNKRSIYVPMPWDSPTAAAEKIRLYEEHLGAAAQMLGLPSEATAPLPQQQPGLLEGVINRVTDAISGAPPAAAQPVQPPPVAVPPPAAAQQPGTTWPERMMQQGGAAAQSAIDAAGPMIQQGGGAAAQDMLAQGAAAAQGAAESVAAALPTLDQVTAMTAQQLDRAVEALSDEQLRELPADVYAAILRKLEGLQ